MPEYVVMFPADDEAAWEAGSVADHQRTWDVDQEFGRLLAARGGAVTGGAGLTPTAGARTLRRGDDGDALVTEGPYAETVEQLSGFFVVSSPSYDDVVEAARVLVRAHPVVEVRAVQEF